MNISLIAFIGLISFLAFGFLVMIYFQYIDGYVRKWKLEAKVKGEK